MPDVWPSQDGKGQGAKGRRASEEEVEDSLLGIVPVVGSREVVMRRRGGSGKEPF